MFAIGMAGSAALTVLVKHLVARARPGAADVLGPVDHSYSFPSGHTLNSAVFLGLLVWLLWPALRSHAARTMAVAAAALLAAGVGASRVYLGLHWVTDVLAAWLLAGAWLSLLLLARDRVCRRCGPVHHHRPHHRRCPLRARRCSGEVCTRCFGASATLTVLVATDGQRLCRRPGGSGASTTRAVSTAHPTKVLVVIEENHSYAQMKAGMPYLFGLSRRYGYASNWSAITHPSLPDYLAISGGSTFGVHRRPRPRAHTKDVGNARSVFDQALDAGKTRQDLRGVDAGLRAPLEPPGRQALCTPCATTRGRTTRRAGPGAARTMSPARASPRAARANALPNVGFLIPNTCNDAHDCSLATADAFLRKTLPDVLASQDFSTGRLAVVVTADEDDKSSGNSVLTSVLSTRLSHKVVTTHLTHYSLTRYIAQVLGVAPLRNGRSAPDMKAAFGL